MQQAGSCVFRFSPYKLTIVSEVVRSPKGEDWRSWRSLVCPFSHPVTQANASYFSFKWPAVTVSLRNMLLQHLSQ